MAQSAPQSKRYFALLGLLIAGLVGLCLYYINVGDEVAKRAAQEGGAIDLTSAIGYFVCAGTMILLGGRHVISRHWRLIISVTLLGLRELDMDKHLFTFGLFKSHTFTSPQVPLTEKVIAAVLVLGVLGLLIGLIRQYTVVMWRSVWRLEAVSWITGFGCGLLVLARVLDGIARKLAEVGIDLNQDHEILTTIVEEVLELGVPLAFILAFFAYWRIYQPGKA